MMGGLTSLKLAALGLAVATAATFLVDASAFAQRYRDFHGRYLRGFSSEAGRIWGSGGWIHDFHNGRSGWWWLAGGFWYYYPAPIYPSPTYVPEPEVVVNAPPDYPPAGYPPPGYPPSGYP